MVKRKDAYKKLAAHDMVKRKDAYKKLIEAELYALEDTKDFLKRMEEGEMRELTPTLLQLRVVRRAYEIVDAIEKVLDEREEFREIYEKFYKKRRTWVRACMEMHRSKSAFYTWRERLIERICEELGLIELKK